MFVCCGQGTLKDRQGLAVSGALSMALQQVNNNPSILKDIQLVSRWNDTKGDRVRATLVITEMLCDGVAAFIGPEGSCFVESIVSQSRNVPMISYVSTESQVHSKLSPHTGTTY
jgi:hypothetical protein